MIGLGSDKNTDMNDKKYENTDLKDKKYEQTQIQILVIKLQLHSVQIVLSSREESKFSLCHLGLRMVHLVEMVPDPATFFRNNKTKYQPVGAGLLVDFNLEDAEYTFIAFMVLVTIFLAVLLKVFQTTFQNTQTFTKHLRPSA